MEAQIRDAIHGSEPPVNATKVIALGLSDRFVREHLSRPLSIVADQVSMEAAIHLAISCFGEVIELDDCEVLANKLPPGLGSHVAEQVCKALRGAGLSYLHVPKGNGSLVNRGWAALQAVAFLEAGGSLSEAKRLFRCSHLMRVVASSPSLSERFEEPGSACRGRLDG